MKTRKECHLRLVRKVQPSDEKRDFDPSVVEKILVEEANKAYGVRQFEA